MKHEIVMVNDEMETDPILSRCLSALGEWALNRKFDPEKPLKITLKATITPYIHGGRKVEIRHDP